MHPIGSLRREYNFLSLKKEKEKKLSDLLCLMSSRSKYNASTINYSLVFSTLRPKIKCFAYKINAYQLYAQNLTTTLKLGPATLMSSEGLVALHYLIFLK